MRKKMTQEELARVQYKVVRGDLSKDKSFTFWRERWPQLVQDLGSSITDEEFLNQHAATYLELDGEIIGLHLLSEYDFDEIDSKPYFSQISPQTKDFLSSNKVEKLQTLQYFIVDEKFSVKNTLVNFGAMIVALSMKAQKERGLDAQLSIARSDVPAASLANKLGFEPIHETKMHNVSVVEMVALETKDYPKSDVMNWVEYYWNGRVELTNEELAS